MKDLTGQRFGRLVVIKATEIRAAGGHIVWECLCDCGNTKLVSASNLKSKNVKSCGCLQHELNVMRPAKMYNKENGTWYKREMTKFNNILSGKLIATNHSGVTGVSYDQSRSAWRSQIKIKGRVYFLGRFSKFEDAVKARKAAEWMLEERIENLEEELSKLKEGDANHVKSEVV